MSKMKELAIDERNEAAEIATQAEALKGRALQYLSRYGALRDSDNISPAELKETASRSLNIRTGIVHFIEVSTEKLIVHFG